MSDKKYAVNEIFLSLQGEGVRAGTANVFVRFQACNLKCSGEVVDQAFQPICDTEFQSGRLMDLGQLFDEVREESLLGNWIILTGGEPGLQVDKEFIDFFHERTYKLAIETNGSIELPEGLDWITVSPKVAEHAIKQRKAHEVKYVRGYGQAIPQTVVEAQHYLISPAFEGNVLPKRTLEWCIQLCKENPKWRLSMQQHKMWNVR